MYGVLWWGLVSIAACRGENPETKPHKEAEEEPVAVDADDDGVTAGLDCDDADPTVFPGAVETCDGVDHDCDGQVDPDGTAAQVDGSGELVATFVSGDDGDAYVNLAKGHTLRVCGAFDRPFVVFYAEGLTVEGRDPDSGGAFVVDHSTGVVFDSIEVHDLVTVASETVVLRDVTLEGGAETDGGLEISDTVVRGRGLSIQSDDQLVATGLSFEQVEGPLFEGRFRNVVDVEGIDADGFDQIAEFFDDTVLSLRTGSLTGKRSADLHAFEVGGSIQLVGVPLAGAGPLGIVSNLDMQGVSIEGLGPLEVDGVASIRASSFADSSDDSLRVLTGEALLEDVTFSGDLGGSAVVTVLGTTLTCDGCVVDGVTSPDAAMHFLGAAVVSGSTFTDNNVYSALLANLSLELRDSVVQGNQTQVASVYLNGVSELDGVTIQGNVSAGSRGGGLYLDSGADVVDSVMIDNTVAGEGGGLSGGGWGLVHLLRTVVAGNQAQSGGGVSIHDGASLSTAFSDVSDNTAANEGGGVVLYDGTLELIDSVVQGNTADVGGGVARLDDWSTPVTLTGTVLSSNEARLGAGVYLSALGGSVVGGRLEGNTATAQGGGMYMAQPEALLQDVVVVDNVGSVGGGIAYAGALTLDSCDVGLEVANQPDDLVHLASGTSSAGLDLSSYRCGPAGCAE